MNKIIQCPSCSTKFALNANQLAGIETPKFHCSRCNTIFSISDDSTPTVSESFIEKSDSADTTLETKEEIDSNDITDEYFENSQELEEQIETEEELFEDALPDEDLDEHSLDSADEPPFPNFEEKVKISRPASEPPLPLNYEPIDAEISEEIEIDWPTDDGYQNYEVDLSSTTKMEAKTSSLTNEPISEKEKPIRNNETPKSLLTSLLGEDNEIPEAKRDHSLSFLFKDSHTSARQSEKKSSASNQEAWSLGSALNETITPSTSLEHEIEKKEPAQTEHSSTVKEEEFNNQQPIPHDNFGWTEQDSPPPPLPKLSTDQDQQNRSFKETTVMKRNEISLENVSDDEEELPNFVPSSDILNTNKHRLVGAGKQIQESLINSNLSDSLNGYVKAWSIPALVLLLLLLFSKSVTSSENKGSNTFSRTIVQTLKLNQLASDLLPPRSLSISDPSGDVISLNSGEKIILARGSIQNSSSKDFNNVKIEARAYDKNNISIVKKISPIPNMLTPTLITEKTFKEVDTLQNTIRVERTNIRAKTIEPFLLAIDISGLTKEYQPKFYGLRVYSVGK